MWKPRPGANDVEVPLFPGYLFLRFDLEEQGSAVRRLPGVSGWVRFGGVAAPVPDGVVADLAKRVEAINSGGGMWTRFRPGDVVRVASGRMESLAEVIEEPRSPEARVRVLLDFMGRQIPAQVPWHTLEAVDRETAMIQKGRRPRRTRGRGRWVQGFGPQLAVGT